MLDAAERALIRRRLQRLAAGEARSGEALAVRQGALAALQRLDQRGFGLCTRCLLEIERSRLLADPTVRWCAGCADDETAAAARRAQV